MFSLHPINLSTDAELVFTYIDLLYGELFGEQHKLTRRVKTSLTAAWQNEPDALSVYVVKHHGDLAGFFTLKESFAIFAHGHYGIINELWVSPEYRGQGTGSIILSYIKQIAKEKHWGRIDVTAPPAEVWQKTFEFYQKNDFVFTGKKLKYLVT